MTMLTFDPVAHRYAWKGRTVPGVTDIISSALGNPFADVPPAVLEHKRAIGVAAHLACHLDDEGKLDESTVHPEVAPRLAAWREFRRAFRFEVYASERPLYHSLHGYAGTPDRGVFVIDGAWRAVIDLKTGLPGPAAALQTAAYAHLLEATFGTPVDRRFALQARDDGTFRLVEYESPADWRDFLSCLNVHRLKERIAA